jgi:hypothetical protein
MRLLQGVDRMGIRLVLRGMDGEICGVDGSRVSR